MTEYEPDPTTVSEAAPQVKQTKTSRDSKTKHNDWTDQIRPGMTLDELAAIERPPVKLSEFALKRLKETEQFFHLFID